VPPWSKISFPVGVTVLPGPILLSGYFPDGETPGALNAIRHSSEIVDGRDRDSDDERKAASSANESGRALVSSIKDRKLARAQDSQLARVSADFPESNRVYQATNPPKSCYAIKQNAEGTTQANAAQGLGQGGRADREAAEGCGRGRDAKTETQGERYKKALAFLKYWDSELTDHEGWLILDSIVAILLGNDPPCEPIASGFQEWLHFRGKEVS
jgi:hypothetical protein